jgi:hypothetical protein
VQVAEQYTVDGQWEDDDILGYLECEYETSDEIASAAYFLRDSDGTPYKPAQDRCDRYDGPFEDDAPERLRHAAGALVHTWTKFDRVESDNIDEMDLDPDAEDKSIEIYADFEALEAAWNRTKHDYESGENRRG